MNTRDAFRLKLEQVAPESLLAGCADSYYEHYTRLLLRFAVRLGLANEADDLIQQVWMHVIAHLDEFTSRQQSGQRVWLWTKMHDKAVEVFRKRARRHETSLGELDPAGSDDEPVDRLATQLKCAAIREVVAGMTPEIGDLNAAILRMRWFEEKTEAEIADAVGLTEHQVRDRCYELKKKLIRRFEKLYGSGAERL